MPAFGDQLSDAQIAAVVNHERTRWGNAAATVEPGRISAPR
jgi:mono/diheme cytochrome c family protein